jgi:hypothetical protein
MDVNFSDKPVFLVSDEKVDKCVNESIPVVSKCLDDIYGPISAGYQSINSGVNTKMYTFKKFFIFSPNAKKRVYDSAWVNAVYEYVLLGDLRASSKLIEVLLGDDSCDYLHPTQPSLRRPLWLLLVLLFKSGCLLLTPLLKAAQFKYGSQVLREFGFDHYPELMAFTLSARDKEGLPAFWESVDRRVRERVAQYGPRLFWIIGACRPEDLTISSLVAVHKKYYYEGERLTAELPVHTILTFVCDYFGERVGFKYDELYHALNALRPVKYKSGTRGELTAIDFFPIMDRSESSEKLIDYCRLLVRTQFMPHNIMENDLLSDTSFINRPALMRWVAVQKTYGEFKPVEAKKNALGMGFLNIYLFVYLEKWFSLFGCDAKWSYPAFISQLDLKFVAPLDHKLDAPLPLKQFISKMADHAPTVKSSALLQLRSIFQWMESKECRDEMGVFRNSLDKVDMFSSPGLTTSDKRPFKRLEYSIAINYLYSIFKALEVLNEDLLTNSYSDILFGDLEKRALALGWNNRFLCGGRSYVVSHLPKCFFKRWLVSLQNEGHKTIFSPHLIVHVLCAVESGLRHQSVQWLSCNFDKYVVGHVELNKAYWLHVVVDKVAKKPMRTIVSGQTIIALRYQQKIRGLIECQAFDNLQSYEGRENNVRDDFLPLFSKDISSGKPHSDAFYSTGYLDFLVAFQFFLSEHGVVAKFYEIKPNGFSYGETVLAGKVKVLNVESPYCPVRLVTDMTPHHTRNSTVKVWQRIMSDSAVGQFKTGQGVRTVRYYGTLIDEDYDEIVERVSSDLSKIWEGQRIDTVLPSSNLQTALRSDPIQALRDFNCITTTHTASVEGDNALRDLRDKYGDGMRHHPTHICTLGDNCTQEIIAEGLEKRCGICIFGVKTLDHLPAIDVKVYNLSLEVEEIHAYADSVPEGNLPLLEEIDRRLETVISDLLGWTWCRDYLVECFRRDSNARGKLISIQPQLMSNHMREVKMESSSLEHVFAMLYENSLYPELQTDVSRAKYNFLKMCLQGGGIDVSQIFKPVSVDPLAVVVGQVKSLLRLNGISVDDVVRMLSIDRYPNFLNYEPIILIDGEE